MLPRILLAASAASIAFVPLKAAWTGDAGNNLINDPANWAGGVIDGVLAPTLTANLTLLADADMIFSSGLSFVHTSDYSLIIEPNAVTSRTFTLGGDINVSIAGNSSSKVVRLGSSAGSRPIVLDLDGGVRTITVNGDLAATAGAGRDTLTLWGNVTNGSLVKTGGGTMEFNNALSLNGSYVNAGGYTLLQNSASMLSIEKVVVGGSSGRFVLKSSVNDRLSDTAAVHLTGGIFGYQYIGGNSVENVGSVYLQGARSAIGLTTGTLHLAELVRDQFSTVALVGSSSARFGEGTTKFTVGSDANILASLSGGGGANGTTTINILPWATATTAISNSFTDAFDSRFASADFGFVTYTSDGGFRALNKTSEYAASLASSANAADNVRLTADETLAGNRTINALFLDKGSNHALNLGGNTLNITSGAIAASNNQITISNGTLNFGEKTGYVITGRSGGSTISANLAGSAGVVFGITPDQTLTISGANSYTGRTVINSGTLALGANDTLPVGTAVRVDKTGTLQVNNNVSQRVAAISGSGVVRLSNSGARLDIGNSVVNSAAGVFTVGSGGSVTVGDDAGYHRVSQLTFSGGSIRFEAGAALNLDISSFNSFDSVNLTASGGTVTIDGGTLSLNFLDGFTPETGDTFQLFSVAGQAVADSVITPENFTILSNVGYTFSLDASGLLTVGSAIPEPSTFSLLAAGTVLFAAAARRRRR